MDAIPPLPRFAFSHETGYQGRIEIHAIVSPVDDRIFLHAPVRFHALMSDNRGNEYHRTEGVKLKIYPGRRNSTEIEYYRPIIITRFSRHQPPLEIPVGFVLTTQSADPP